MLLNCFFSALSDNDCDLLERLFTVYEKRIYNLSLKILKNQADAEDNTIQVFFNLSKALNRLEPDIESQRNKAYIYAITKNAALNICRARSYETAKTHRGITKGYIDNIEFDELCFLMLTDDMKAVSETDTELLILKYVYGLSGREIARKLGVSVESVKVRIHRAKARMKANEGIRAYSKGAKL